MNPEEVVTYLRSTADRPMKAKGLAEGLGIDPARRSEFTEMLERLEQTGILYRVKGGRYAVPDKINLVVGTVQTIRSGAGFVVPDDGDGDLFVPAQALASAVHGDRVVARVERRRRRERDEGRVIKVLERGRETVVGAYQVARNFGFVEPDDRKLTRDVFVPPGQEADATDGDVVVVRVSSWGDEKLGPSGEVIAVLGARDEPGVDVLSILHSHGLAPEFPEEVQSEAEAVREAGLTADDLDGREDLREEMVFAIDPSDAEDHDDALSIRSLGSGLWQVGIHIADVSHYVTPGSATDEEALRRGTSVYLVDRVVPMLPEALSGDLCSLREDEDRLALSLLLVLNDDAEVQSHRLVRSVIRSRTNMSYDDAQAVLDGERSMGELDDALRALRSLSRKLRSAREARGSLDFDLPEARVVLNTKGEPTDIQRVLRLESHKLIEDFMLLANETIARRATRRQSPFLYRIHEPPNAEKVEQLRDFVATFGIRLSRSETPTPKELQQVLDQVRDRPEEGLISMVVLRSMMQARYSADNLGHFGLAADHYTHFTSPIRRYPDLMVHRLAVRLFIEEAGVPDEAREQLPEVARYTSARERVAVSAERESVDLKKVEFMERHLGDEFDGTISGVTSFGVFVLLDDFFVEGLVHVSSLDDDYYVYLEEQYALVGENTRRRLRLGERVRIRVDAVNRHERQIDFRLLDVESL